MRQLPRLTRSRRRWRALRVDDPSPQSAIAFGFGLNESTHRRKTVLSAILPSNRGDNACVHQIISK